MSDLYRLRRLQDVMLSEDPLVIITWAMASITSSTTVFTTSWSPPDGQEGREFPCAGTIMPLHWISESAHPLPGGTFQGLATGGGHIV